jgi:hypothetical protein
MNPAALPNSFLDKIADPAERKRLIGSPLLSAERHAAEDAKVERELHKLIINELLRRGIFFIHSRMDRKSTQALGTPDFAFVIGGLPVAVECKTATGSLTQEQRAVSILMQHNGWAYHIVRSFDEFRAVLLGHLTDC